ncbi:SigB/SigF/SigG family RNA polymerase sigma factor [Streptomyces omiyaensis]|uniref:SigB/SigF/SigG family RNA polymerase sigma factor n=1 Tax=Streptomyces omiyaensis TaxID=68247 RepID=UPI001678C14C|nr:SigB/SigF/SigG family RNA polymerase sigma factor [Streptomyces omiyaensis]GGY40063.1 RNA polymerase sigma factor [Streptomyces omiyaensis]
MATGQAAPSVRTDRRRLPPTPAARRRALGPLKAPERPLDASTQDARTLSVALFRRLGTLDEGTQEHAYVRNTLVELNLSLVKFAARRFRGRPEPMEDIVQVGTIGLIKAIDRFDPGRGVEFSAFALPTVVGEMKRFFRDTGWAVRVPRRLQELRIELAKASDALEQRDGHRPDRAALAGRLHLTTEEVAEGELASHAYTAHSLDAPVGDDGSGAPLGAVGLRTAVEEPAYELVDDLDSLRPLLTRLDERDRLILSLRFGQELTQAEIGRRVGLSQMHVSRLLARILGELRAGLLDDGATADATEG